jgi:hypothetical protein
MLAGSQNSPTILVGERNSPTILVGMSGTKPYRNTSPRLAGFKLQTTKPFSSNSARSALTFQGVPQ